MATRRARTAPNIAPGKKPATTASLENAGHGLVEGRGLAVSPEEATDGAETGVKVAAVEDMEPVSFDVFVAAGAAAFRTNSQVLFPAHE